jgi:hypothetical protein
MPIHVHPVIRALEEVEEAEHLIVTLDSVGVTIKKAQEAAGTSPKVVPVGYTWIVRGDAHKAV